MSKSINRVTLIGHVGGKPEIRTTQEGKKIASFSLATSESWRDKETGEKKENTDWHRVVVFNQALVEVVENRLDKGDKVYVQGGVHYRKWLDKDGKEKEVTEVMLQNYGSDISILSSKKAGAEWEHKPDHSESSEISAGA